jgi:Ca-activated chloride channel family protein
VGVWVDAPDGTAAIERAPMAVSLVVDTSGSMSGDKIAYARMAAASLLESLAEGDIVSVYAFSNDVVEIAPPTQVDATSRNWLSQRVQMLMPQGGTNMYDGVRVGQSRLAEAPATHPVRRLVVISDGRANVGPSDPFQLGQLAANGTEWGTQVSAIGVGLDYDERTLAALAVQSAGRLYHLEHPAQMAVILREELDLLAQTIATNAVIEIVPAAGVRVLDVLTPGATVENGRVRANLGSLHAGQSREILFRAAIDTQRRGDHQLASAQLSYRQAGSTEREATQQSVALGYSVTDDRGAAQASAPPRVQAMVATYEASQAQLRAVELLNQGRNQEAAVALDGAGRTLDAAAAAAPAAAPFRQRLEQQRSTVQRGSVRARSSTSQTESRATSLEMNDSAYGAMGY